MSYKAFMSKLFLLGLHDPLSIFAITKVQKRRGYLELSTRDRLSLTVRRRQQYLVAYISPRPRNRSLRGIIVSENIKNLEIGMNYHAETEVGPDY